MAEELRKYVATIRTNCGEVRIPAWVVDHPSFLRWFRSTAVPEDVRVGYIRDDVWLEHMPERAFAHNRLKSLVTSRLLPLVDDHRLGVFFGDGMTFTSEAAGFTTVPDGLFASREAVEAGRVRLVGGARSHQDTELVGVPDLVIEVVSDASADKDTAWLMGKYADAGIPEYWVIDGRRGPIRFTVHRLGPKGYVATRKAGRWVKSVALGRAFRFVPWDDQMGHPTYRLEVR